MTHEKPDLFWPIVLTLMATDFVASLEASMIFSALPTMARELGGFSSVGWLISSFTLVQAVSAVIGGKLGDMFGRRLLLMIVLLLSAVGSLVSAVSQPLELIIAGRSLQGISGAILPLSFGIIRENSTQERAAFGVGLVVGAYTVSGAVGYILGGAFSDAGNWRGIFHLTAVLPLVAIAALWFVVPTGLRNRALALRDIDLVGALVLLPAVGGLLLGITEGLQTSWLSPRTLGFLAGGAGVLAFWVWYELRRSHPLINLRRLNNRTVLLAIACFFLVGAGPFQVAIVMLALAQQPVWTGIGLGLGATAAGLVKLPGQFGGLVGSAVGGKLTQRIGTRAVALWASLILIAGWLMMLAGANNLPAMVITSLLTTIGLTVLMASVPTMLMEVTREEETSGITGFAYLVRAMGLSVGAQLISALLASSSVVSPHDGKSYPAGSAFTLAIGVVIGIAVLAFVLIALIPREDRAEKQVAAS